MIIDLERFIRREEPYWKELEAAVSSLEGEPAWKLDLPAAMRLHYLYERASAALSQSNTFSSDPNLRAYLESLVARCYAVIHSAGRPRRRFSPIGWFFGTFPRTFRLHFRAFLVSAAAFLIGAAFGAVMLVINPNTKGIVIPDAAHVQQTPTQRVEKEESVQEDRLSGKKTAFSAMLMTNNTRVSMLVLALGLTWGIGTIAVLFYNGVIVGAIAADYIAAGQTSFLVGWLLPHGSVEIPAVLLAGQAGLVLASALIGWGVREPLKARLRQIAPSLVTLIFGVAILLVWAGIIEAFLSQYHEPVLPYWLKITFGCVELILLALFLAMCGRSRRKAAAKVPGES